VRPAAEDRPVSVDDEIEDLVAMALVVGRRGEAGEPGRLRDVGVCRDLAIAVPHVVARAESCAGRRKRGACQLHPGCVDRVRETGTVDAGPVPGDRQRVAVVRPVLPDVVPDVLVALEEVRLSVAGDIAVAPVSDRAPRLSRVKIPASIRIFRWCEMVG